MGILEKNKNHKKTKKKLLHECGFSKLKAGRTKNQEDRVFRRWFSQHTEKSLGKNSDGGALALAIYSFHTAVYKYNTCKSIFHMKAQHRLSWKSSPCLNGSEKLQHISIFSQETKKSKSLLACVYGVQIRDGLNHCAPA